MKSRFESFFNINKNTKTNNSCAPIPTFNRGGIEVNNSGCYGDPSIKITTPHISVGDEKKAAENHTYTIKF